MNVRDYISNVCGNNRLRADADRLILSNEALFLLDRHVDDLPKGLDARNGCQAGLALLVQWSKEVMEVRERGLYATTPILIIDDSWLKSTRHTPPPHVVVTLAKQAALLREPRIDWAFVDLSDFPLPEVFFGEFSFPKITRGSAPEEEEWDDPGYWVVQFPVSARR